MDGENDIYTCIWCPIHNLHYMSPKNPKAAIGRQLGTTYFDKGMRRVQTIRRGVMLVLCLLQDGIVNVSVYVISPGQVLRPHDLSCLIVVCARFVQLAISMLNFHWLDNTA